MRTRLDNFDYWRVLLKKPGVSASLLVDSYKSNKTLLPLSLTQCYSNLLVNKVEKPYGDGID